MFALVGRQGPGSHLIKLDLKLCLCRRLRLTQFHEEAHRRRGAGTAVRPEDDIIRVGVTPALEEVEEQMARLDVDVPAVRARGDLVQRRVAGLRRRTYRAVSLQKCDCLMRAL